MKAFDADVLTLILQGDADCVQKASRIPATDQSVPVVVVEEVLRGRLNVVRQAQSGKTKIPIEHAYHLLERSLADFRHMKILSASRPAEDLVAMWRKQKIRIGISDLRIAAICMVHSATLISRNRKDFSQVPGLTVEYW